MILGLVGIKSILGLIAFGYILSLLQKNRNSMEIRVQLPLFSAPKPNVQPFQLEADQFASGPDQPSSAIGSFWPFRACRIRQKSARSSH